MQNTVKILDCTLRDGGYYNNWDFSPVVVEKYLKAVAEAKIDFVELGLRNFSKAGFLGAFAYTTEEFLNRLELPYGPTYGVMVDANTILGSGLSIDDAVNKLFVDSNKSKISLVRIAAHFKEVESSKLIAKLLKNKGYLVGFNIMQAGGKSSELISEKAALIHSWECVDTLYFADSLGNMDDKEVSRITKAIQLSWDLDIGIHTHNNMGKALDNTLVAKCLGVHWLDVTISGMGRGAGNAQTENLLATLSKTTDRYNPKPIYELVIRWFDPMQKSLGWGANLLYFLGAQNDIHPTYIQNLLQGSEYGDDEIVGAIDYLSNLEGTTSYDGGVLESAISFSNTSLPLSGSDFLVDKFSGKEILILANGPSLERYATNIEAYISIRKPVVLAINIVTAISNELIDFYCISHNSKYLSQNKLYNTLNKPIITSLHRFSESERRELLEDNQVIDYGIEVSKNVFSVYDTYCQIPVEVTLAYALSIARISSACKISLVGVDGYSSNDRQQLEMIEILSLFSTSISSVEMSALTPTTYPIEQGSIFAPFTDE